MTELSAQIPAKNCGTFTPDYHVTGAGPVNLSSLGLSGGINNKTFIVDADLVIDVSTYFTSCLFKVAPGKKITIKNLPYVVFYRCNLYSCDDRWLGIEVVDNNSSLILHQNVIENALSGLLINNKTGIFLSVFHNDFYNNHTGIYFQGAPTFVYTRNFGNKFHGDPVSFKGTVPFTRLPAYGIRMESTGGTIHYNIGYYGTDISNVTPNEFYNLYISGVYLDYAWTQISGAKFYDFYDVPDSYPYSFAPIEGAGITAYSPDLTVLNNPGDPYPRIEFDNLDYGIYAKLPSFGIDVYNVKIQSCPTAAIWGDFISGNGGFLIADSDVIQPQDNTDNFYRTYKDYTGLRFDGYTRWLGIEDNHFLNHTLGGTVAVPNNQVVINYNGPGGLVHIPNNTFENSVQSSNSFLISNYSGIGVVFTNNLFQYAPIATPYPIFTKWQTGILDSRNMKVYDNLYKDAQSDCNIHNQANNQILYCKNVFERSNLHGFHATHQGIIDLAKTTFGDHPQGLLLSKVGAINPIIGVQYCKENCWTMMNPGADAHNEATTLGEINASKFWANNTIPCNYPTTIVPGIWFGYDKCEQPNYCEDQQVPENLLERTYDELSWDAKYEWYLILSNRDLRNDDETAFMTKIQNTNIPALAAAEEGMAALEIPEHKMDEFKILRHDILAKQDAINAIMDNYNDGRPQGEDSVAVYQLFADMTIMKAEYDHKWSDELREKENRTLEMITTISNITAVTHEEATYKDYLTILTKSRLKDAPMEEIHTKARQLANLDEAMYGAGARKAHYLLPRDEYNAYITQIGEHCRENHEIQQLEQENGQIGIEMPRLEKIQKNVFNIHSDTDQSSNYSIIDNSGRMVRSGNLSIGENRLDLTDLNTGIYYYKQQDKAGITKIFIEP